MKRVVFRGTPSEKILRRNGDACREFSREKLFVPWERKRERRVNCGEETAERRNENPPRGGIERSRDTLRTGWYHPRGFSSETHEGAARVTRRWIASFTCCKALWFKAHREQSNIPILAAHAEIAVRTERGNSDYVITIIHSVHWFCIPPRCHIRIANFRSNIKRSLCGLPLYRWLITIELFSNSADSGELLSISLFYKLYLIVFFFFFLLMKIRLQILNCWKKTQYLWDILCLTLFSQQWRRL